MATQEGLQKCKRCPGAAEPGRVHCTACLVKMAIRDKQRRVETGKKRPRTYAAL